MKNENENRLVFETVLKLPEQKDLIEHKYGT
jgi:hypothetical protein